MAVTIDKLLGKPLMHSHVAADLPAALGALAVEDTATLNLTLTGSTLKGDVLSSYTLPTAAADTLGGIKVGTRLSIAAGVLSADATDLSGYSTKLQADALYAPIAVTQYTNEMAQDAVGGVIGTGLAYDDPTGAISCTITQYTDAMAVSAVDLSGLVPYTGATANVDLGANFSLFANTIRSTSVFENWNSGGMDLYSDAGVTQLGTLWSDTVDTIKFQGAGSNIAGVLDFSDLTLADKTFTFPNASGTLALTTDITGTNSGTNTGDNATNTQYSGLAASKADTGQTFYIGTTQVAINRASAALTLAGITLTTPEIGVATGVSLILDQGALDTNILDLRSSDVAQPATALDGASTYGAFVKSSATSGGLTITGYSDGDATGLSFVGMMGTADPTDARGAFRLVGQKSDGSTGAAALGDAETVIQFLNLTTNLLRVYGNGDATLVGGLTTQGNNTFGNASTDLTTNVGRMIFRTAASDPKHATAGSRPAGTVGEIAYYSGKLYLCTNAATPLWEAITSS